MRIGCEFEPCARLARDIYGVFHAHRVNQRDGRGIADKIGRFGNQRADHHGRIAEGFVAGEELFVRAVRRFIAIERFAVFAFNLAGLIIIGQLNPFAARDRYRKSAGFEHVVIDELLGISALHDGRGMVERDCDRRFGVQIGFSVQRIRFAQRAERVFIDEIGGCADAVN